MRRLVALPLAALLAATIAACGGVGAGGGDLEVETPDFDVELPAGWREPTPAEVERAERFVQTQVDRFFGEGQVEEGYFDYRFLGAAPARGRAIVASAEAALEPAPGLSIEAFTDLNRTNIERANTELRGLTAPVEAELGGEPALSYEYVERVGGVTSAFRTLHAVRDDVGVTINFSAPPNGLDRWEADFDAIAADWTWSE